MLRKFPRLTNDSTQATETHEQNFPISVQSKAIEGELFSNANKAHNFASNPARRRFGSKKTKSSLEGTSRTGRVGSISYRLAGITLEENDRSDIYGVAFNHFIAKTYGTNIFATCGNKLCTAYECLSDGTFRACISYRDTSDYFYSCDWSFCIKTGNPWLLTAGKLGRIRVIDTVLGKAVRTLISHGGAVNDLKVNQRNPHQILTASKDFSIRLWNLKTFTLVAIFGGVDGHRDEVVSVSFHQSLPCFASGGIDYGIKIWSLDSALVSKAWNNSNRYVYDLSQSRQFPTEHIHTPLFSTRDVHQHYVDCVEWFGDLIMSRSYEEEIVIWNPIHGSNTNLERLLSATNSEHSKTEIPTNETTAAKQGSTKQSICIIGRIPVEKSSAWYIRFAVDRRRDLLAIGNTEGNIFLVDLKSLASKCDSVGSICIERVKIPAHQSISKKYIRQLSFNYDSTILVAVTDQSFVVKYDITRNCPENLNKSAEDSHHIEYELANMLDKT